MVDRINLLLQAKNITARQFAEEIGIQPSGISHILSGRNNPSLDFVMKVIKRWPEININWLMFGKGEMYDHNSNVPSPATVPTAPADNKTVEQPEAFDLFSQPNIKIDSGHVDSPHDTKTVDTKVVNPPTQLQRQEPQSTVEMPAKEPAPQSVITNNTTHDDIHTKPVEIFTDDATKPPVPVQRTLDKKSIVKIIVLYSDHSFSEYFPE